MRISDWSSDVCSSDLTRAGFVDLLHSRTRDWTVSKTSKKSLLRSTVAPLILGTTLFASQAFAQEPESSTGEGQAIIVTGSRIARPTLDYPIPVTTVTATALTRRGQPNVGDVLKDRTGVEAGKSVK